MGRGHRVPRSFLLFRVSPHSNNIPRWPGTLKCRAPRRFHLQPGAIDPIWAWTDELLLGEWALKHSFGTLYPRDEATYSKIGARLSVVRTASAMRTKLQRMSSNGRRSGLLGSLRLLVAAQLDFFTEAEASARVTERASDCRSGGRGSNLRRKSAAVEQPDFRISVVFKDARRTLEL